MRIDSIQGVNVYEAFVKENTKAKKAIFPDANSNSQDRLELSDEGLKYGEASSAAARLKITAGNDADGEKIQALKEKIANGTYHVSGMDIADAIVNGLDKKKA